jgi:hypothetical protein
MALSMDEQRALAEIERRLAADDPGLATCLTAFRRPGPANVLRSPRARIVGSLFTVLLVAMVSLMVYAMIPFRTHGTRPSSVVTSTGTQQGDAMTATGTGGGNPHPSVTASTGAPAKSAAPSPGQGVSTASTEPGLSQAAGPAASEPGSP